jgi:hypothetical protein
MTFIEIITMTTIQAQVSPATLSKVSRLFNSSLTDCFNELLQNARRAGASTVTITLSEAHHLTIADNGSGIADPQTLLTLGQSDWSAATQQQEDPAGMGIFSLANRHVTIQSHDWQVHLTPAHFTGEAIAPIAPSDRIDGTRLSFPITEINHSELRDQINRVAKFYPLPVWFNNEELPRQDFLEGARYVEKWQGLRLGVCPRYQWTYRFTLNFYGLTLEQPLPNLRCNEETLSVRVDITQCPQLKLVLPARKEVVQDEFWKQITTEIHRVLYRYVGTLPHHDLSYSEWQKAQLLGVHLPVARSHLHEFTPAIANRYATERSQSLPVSERSLLVHLDGLACSEQQVFWRAFQQAQLPYEAVEPDVSYIGYPWYDTLPNLRDVRFEIEFNGVKMTAEQWQERENVNTSTPTKLNFKVDQVWAIAQLRDASQRVQEIRFPCDVLFLEAEERYWDEVEQTPILLSQSAQLTVDELATLLEDSYFSPSEEGDADSVYTQQENFREMAYERATTALLTREAALEARLRMTAERHLRWMVPLNQKLEIRLVPRDGDEPAIVVNLNEVD